MRSEDDHIFLSDKCIHFYLNFESILSLDFNDKYTKKNPITLQAFLNHLLYA